MGLCYRLLAVAGALLLVAGCAGPGTAAGPGGTVHITQAPAFDNNATARYAATIRLLPYTDGRKSAQPRQIGTGGYGIYGFGAPNSNAILLDQDVADVVTAAMAQGLRDAGYRVVPSGDAQFEMTGTVIALSYDVKARDEVNISVSTQIKDIRTGNILWSGVVVEKQSRYPGDMGDTIADVAGNLKKELGIVVHKTVDSINTPLMEHYPGLFNLAPGSHPAAGVTVLHQAPAPEAPGESGAAAAADNGVLKITTRPAHAEIYIGGVYYGQSPLKLKLAPGILEVTARMDGRKTVKQKVSVRSGDTTVLKIRLKK